MTREEIKKQWELEFGAKYEEYQRANVYTAIDILDFAESVVNKLLISGVSQQRELLIDCVNFCDGLDLIENSTVEEQVDSYLLSINCGQRPEYGAF